MFLFFFFIKNGFIKQWSIVPILCIELIVFDHPDRV